MSRRVLAVLMAFAVLAAAPASAAAQGSNATLPDIEDEVMCPTCRVPLNTANSPQADEQRTYIRGLIAEGRDKEQIKDALVAEYGQDVLALPSDRGFDLAAYVVPIAAVLLLIGGLALLIPRWRRRPPPASPAIDGPQLSTADATRLDDDLRRYDP